MKMEAFFSSERILKNIFNKMKNINNLNHTSFELGEFISDNTHLQIIKKDTMFNNFMK